MKRLQKFWTALAHRFRKPRAPRRQPESCPEWERLLRCYIHALEEYTAAHLEFVRALGVNVREPIAAARHRVDLAEEALRLVSAELKQHRATHACGPRS